MDQERRRTESEWRRVEEDMARMEEEKARERADTETRREEAELRMRGAVEAQQRQVDLMNRLQVSDKFIMQLFVLCGRGWGDTVFIRVESSFGDVCESKNYKLYFPFSVAEPKLF